MNSVFNKIAMLISLILFVTPVFADCILDSGAEFAGIYALNKLVRQDNLKEQLLNDINHLQSDNKSIAIITKTDTEAEKIYKLLHKDLEDLTLIKNNSKKFSRTLVTLPSYMAKGLEFDATIIYTEKDNSYTYDERYLYYVSCTRSQHHLIIYNNK